MKAMGNLIWRCRDRTLDLSRQGSIMGILNVTPDSFSDGGSHADQGAALAAGLAMIDAGAGIVDVGGESSRPGAEPVAEAEEIRRVVPVIAALRAARPAAFISVDTVKPEVAAAAIEAGADIVNDITGLRGPGMIEAVRESGAGVVVMHMQGTPRTMQQSPRYDDVTAEVRGFFAERHASLSASGLDPESLVYDPGIGFGKTLDHNFSLLRSLTELAPEGRPLLIGVSRKSLIAAVLGEKDLARRSMPTVALTAWTREKGVRVHRVHEVAPNLQALRMMEAILAVP